MASSSVPLVLKIAAAASALTFAALPAHAGLDKAKVTADSAIVYLGVVPAAQTRDYSVERTGNMNRAAPPRTAFMAFI